MLRTIIKSRLHSKKHKTKTKQEVNNTKSTLPPHLPPHHSNTNFYQETVLLYINELGRFSIIR